MSYYNDISFRNSHNGIVTHAESAVRSSKYYNIIIAIHKNWHNFFIWYPIQVKFGPKCSG